ncbi:acyl-CoA thioesterase [Deinococcus sp.]|uniref:acyl-CoA thioesterase n=1 Tax=Deinococcus sp. TaxID=47478 RepID=UPI003C7B7AE3
MNQVAVSPPPAEPAYWLRSFALQLTVQSAELDELGHVNNVIYLGWIEQVARTHAEAVGAGFAVMEAQGVVAVVRKHSLHYHRPALLGDEIDIQTSIIEGGGLKAIRHNRIANAVSGELLVEGQTEWVWIDPRSGRPKRPPEALLAKFGF